MAEREKEGCGFFTPLSYSRSFLRSNLYVYEKTRNRSSHCVWNHFVVIAPEQQGMLSQECSVQAPIIFGEPGMWREQAIEGAAWVLPGAVLERLSTTCGGTDCKPVAAMFGSEL